MTDVAAAAPPATVAVVGAGAAGAAVAWLLARRGVDVVCLERGAWVDQRAAPSLRPDWERALQRRFHPDPAVRRLPEDYPVDAADSAIRPALYPGVGGSTIRWGAHFPRLHPSDFRLRSLDGVADDWPIAYDDLAPWYDLNDRMTGVAGLAGDPANPPRPERTGPPLPLDTATARLAAGFDRLGWHWWPSDAAILTVARDGRDACNNCGPCGVGCPRHARAGTDVTYWPAALAAGARLVTGARVTRVESGADGAVTGLLYRDAADRLVRQPAARVVLAASGLGTPRLLLASAGPAHPEGLANGSGRVGVGLMLHPTAIVTGLFRQDLGAWRGPFACALYSQEFYETDRRHGFVRGYQMQALRGVGPATTALGGYAERLPWGAGHHDAFARRFGRSASLTVTSDDLPEPGNRVTLDPARRDGDGVPVVRMHYRVGANTRALLDHGIASARRALAAAGAAETAVTPLARGAGFHFLGTARMGDDPATSVVDGWGRAHDAPGLWIVDGSVFVTAGALNPTPTLQAFALRAADRLAAELGATREIAA